MVNTTHQPGKTYFGIQALRGVAALMVVFHHATQAWVSRVGGITHNDGWASGAAGVDIFFVISGFVMTISAAQARKLTAVTFLQRRVLRIVPMYWIVSLFALGKFLLLARSGKHLPSLLALLSSFLFVPSFQHGDLFLVLPVGWTLCFEFFFYLLFSLALVVLPRSPLRILVPTLLLLSTIGLWSHHLPPLVGFYLSPLLLEFLAGVALASMQLGRLRLSAWPGLLLTLGGALGILLLPEYGGIGRVLGWGVSAALIVAAAILLEQDARVLLPKWLLHLGDASYSLYLVHPLCLSALTLPLLLVPGLRGSELAFALLFAILASIAGSLLYRSVEDPLTRILGRRKPGGQTPRRDTESEPAIAA